ncbi:MAG TPA: TraR/DksA family transcriptional regulator [Patescibacteria group bacterium]|nr:TraR/DksA family transcriptional regulator [Patescibacteria group bacterium]
MEKASLAKIKKALQEEKIRLEKELSNVAEKKGKKFNPVYPEYGSKDEENAAELQEYEIHFALDRNIEKLLTQVIKALAKIESGDYGKCEICGADIGDERLAVSPSSTLCIACQSKKDNKITKFFSRFKNIKNKGRK